MLLPVGGVRRKQGQRGGGDIQGNKTGEKGGAGSSVSVSRRSVSPFRHCMMELSILLMGGRTVAQTVRDSRERSREFCERIDETA
jgi:hypothetical protein